MVLMKLGIFDSGIGGEAIATTIKHTFPHAQIIIVNDRKNLPYGDKTASEIISLTDIAIQPLLEAKCDAIVIACNTATSVAIDNLRTKYNDQIFIGIEPMIKTAANLTKAHTIAVCATPATLNSQRYNNLVKKYGTGLAILEPDCSDWAQMIEQHKVDTKIVSDIINDVCDRGADIIVLGCTHYNWIKDLIIKTAANRAQIIEPSHAVCERIKELLQSS
jgi:glutamate racemase